MRRYSLDQDKPIGVGVMNDDVGNLPVLWYLNTKVREIPSIVVRILLPNISHVNDDPPRSKSRTEVFNN